MIHLRNNVTYRVNKYSAVNIKKKKKRVSINSVKVTQSCPILCNPIDPWNSLGQNTGVGSLSLFEGIFPIQGSNPGLPHCRQILYQLSHKGSLRILEWVAYPFLQWIFLTQKSNRGLLHYRQILYQLSYQESPSIKSDQIRSDQSLSHVRLFVTP